MLFWEDKGYISGGGGRGLVGFVSFRCSLEKGHGFSWKCDDLVVMGEI